MAGGIVAFTGTRRGMSRMQKARVQQWLEAMGPELVFHGGCEGADWDLHQILLFLRGKQRQLSIDVFPSDLPDTYPKGIKKQLARTPTIDGRVDFAVQAAWANLGADAVHLPWAPRERNRWMITTADDPDFGTPDSPRLLIATPRLNRGEEMQSGTWATVRYARKVGLPVLIVRPNGDYQLEQLMGSSAPLVENHFGGA